MVMQRGAWIAAAMVLLSVEAACSGQGLEPSASGPATPSARPTVVPAAMSCSLTPSADDEPLVIDWSGKDQVLLDSFRDPTHPVPLCATSRAYDIRFISRTEIGFASNSSPQAPIGGTTTIGRMSLTDPKPVAVVVAKGEVTDLAWSPDGSSLAYLLYTWASASGSGPANQLWLKTGSAAPRALTPLIPLSVRDGSIDDQVLVRFSHDGRYLLLVDTLVAGVAPATADQASFQVRSVPDGKLAWVPPGALGVLDKSNSYVTMASWSHRADRIYYRDATGVHTWDPPRSVDAMFDGPASWYSPSLSQDDRFVAYAVNLGGQPHVEVRDLLTGAVRIVPGIRGAPFFVSDSLLLEAEYFPEPWLGSAPLYRETGSDFLFDLRTNAEIDLVAVSNPVDYWPH
jgi:WD40 repeat protein